MESHSNIAAHLPLMARMNPERCAIRIPRGRTSAGTIDYLSLSFSELETETAAWRRKLETAGLVRGDRCLVMVRAGLPLIASVFALLALGAVPVVIDPGMGLRSFLNCVRRSRPRGLVGIPAARLISHVARSSFASVKVRVAASSRPDARLASSGDELNLEVVASEARDMAAILFTSGSTGAPKGVCYEHGMFQAQVEFVRSLYDIRPGEVDLPLLPVFALFNPALGMTTIVPEMDPRRPASIDPAKIVQAIQQEGVTNSFGSPTLWRIIGSHCLEKGITLPTLKRVLCAGAPVPARLWQEAPRFLTEGQLHSPYGATEALPVASVSSDEIDAGELKGALVGRVTPGVEVKVIAISDEPIASLQEAQELAAGQIGEIIVKGPMVTRLYDALPDATAAAKIPDGDALWHRMGDAGFLDEQGRLWFCGRKAERVVGAELTWHTEPVERIFRRHPQAARCALVGLGSRGAQKPALVVEAKPANSSQAREWARELRLLAKEHPVTQSIDTFYFRPKFPVDVRHNAKIHRLTLARWAKTAVGYRSDPKR